MELLFNPGGQVRCVYGEAIDLHVLGQPHTDKHVSLLIGPRTVHLEIDTGGRSPNAESVIPRIDQAASRLHLSDDGARYLTHVLPRLSGDKDDSSPVTLDLGQEVVLRTRGERSPQPNEVLLSGSSCEGSPVRVACNRRFLWRVVQLGFRDIVVRKATTPSVCRDETRTYLFMPLEGALSAAPDTVRIVSGESIPVANRAKPYALASAMQNPQSMPHTR